MTQETQELQIIDQPYDEREQALVRLITEMQERHRQELQPLFDVLAFSRSFKPPMALATSLPIYTSSELRERLKHG